MWLYSKKLIKLLWIWNKHTLCILNFLCSFPPETMFLDFGLTNTFVKYVLHIFFPSEYLWQVHPSAKVGRSVWNPYWLDFPLSVGMLLLHFLLILIIANAKSFVSLNLFLGWICLSDLVAFTMLCSCTALCLWIYFDWFFTLLLRTCLQILNSCFSSF